MPQRRVVQLYWQDKHLEWTVRAHTGSQVDHEPGNGAIFVVANKWETRLVKTAGWDDLWQRRWGCDRVDVREFVICDLLVDILRLIIVDTRSEYCSYNPLKLWRVSRSSTCKIDVNLALRSTTSWWSSDAKFVSLPTMMRVGKRLPPVKIQSCLSCFIRQEVHTRNFLCLQKSKFNSISVHHNGTFLPKKAFQENFLFHCFQLIAPWQRACPCHHTGSRCRLQHLLPSWSVLRFSQPASKLFHVWRPGRTACQDESGENPCCKSTQRQERPSPRLYSVRTYPWHENSKWLGVGPC